MKCSINNFNSINYKSFDVIARNRFLKHMFKLLQSTSTYNMALYKNKAFCIVHESKACDCEFSLYICSTHYWHTQHYNSVPIVCYHGLL